MASGDINDSRWADDCPNDDDGFDVDEEGFGDLEVEEWNKFIWPCNSTTKHYVAVWSSNVNCKHVCLHIRCVRDEWTFRFWIVSILEVCIARQQSETIEVCRQAFGGDDADRNSETYV